MPCPLLTLKAGRARYISKATVALTAKCGAGTATFGGCRHMHLLASAGEASKSTCARRSAQLPGKRVSQKHHGHFQARKNPLPLALTRKNGFFFAVRKGGLEPPRSCDHWHLKPARLPIPPLAHYSFFIVAEWATKITIHTPLRKCPTEIKCPQPHTNQKDAQNRHAGVRSPP